MYLLSTFALISNIINSQNENKNVFSFVYLSAIWLQFGQNSIEIIIDNSFELDFAVIVSNEIADK